MKLTMVPTKPFDGVALDVFRHPSRYSLKSILLDETEIEYKQLGNIRNYEIPKRG